MFVDAHTVIWHIEDSVRLSPAASAVMNDTASRLFVPIIALVEACHIVGRNRTQIPSVAALLSDLDADPRFTIVPLSRDILDISLGLTSVTEMHDRLIVAATLFVSRFEGAIPLITCDRNITASGLVPIVW